MRHVRIGTIKQVKVSKTKEFIYLVSLFKHKENYKFNTLNEAKFFCEDTAHVILAEGEVSAVCFKYKRISGFSSYIMYDYLWDQTVKNHKNASFSEYEETEFEYMDSHAWIPYWKKAKKVNERSYCAGDILRASIAHTPFSAIGLVAFSSMIFTAVIMILSLVFYNANKYMSANVGTLNSLIFFQAIVVLCGLCSLIIPHVKLIKVIKAHKRNFNEVDWKEIFRRRQKYSYISIAILWVSMLICVAMLIVVFKTSFAEEFAQKRVKVFLITLITIHMFRLITILAGRAFAYWKIAHFVNHLYAEVEYPEFKSWLKTQDPIWEFRTNVDFFIIPHEHSLPFVNAEKELVNSILADSDTQEIKMLAKKARRGYKAAIKNHFNILRGKNVNL